MINEVVRKKKSEKININEIISIQGDKIVGSKECANVMNDYFINVGLTNLGNEDQATKHTRRIEETIYLFPANVQEIEEIIKNMKQGKATGPDVIQARTYKDNYKILSPIITKLINNSMEQGIFPSSLKTARIIPIHKG